MASQATSANVNGRDALLYPPPLEPPRPISAGTAPIIPPVPGAGASSDNDASSVRSGKSKKSKKKNLPPPVPAHKLAFQAFHAELGVRLLKGSIGPVDDVPMMLRNGYRHVYVAREFALAHGFIPKDTVPGSYGYNGITNLGKWPIRVGSKTVSFTVMLAEDSYFPVILGRSFMEKRGVRTDPLDMTSVVFMDTNEKADVEIVVVRDEQGEPIPIP